MIRDRQTVNLPKLQVLNQNWGRLLNPHTAPEEVALTIS